MRWVDDVMMFLFVFLRRCVFQSFDADAPAPDAAGYVHSPQHHIPDLRVSAGLRCLVLPQRRYLLHRQDRRVVAVQLRVSVVWRHHLTPIFHHVLLVYLSINHYLARFSGWQLIVWNFCPVFSPGALTGTWANDANTRISMALICVSCFHCFLNHKYILCFSTRYSTHRFCFWPPSNFSISLFRWNIIMLKSFSYSYC